MKGGVIVYILFRGAVVEVARAGMFLQTKPGSSYLQPRQLRLHQVQVDQLYMAMFILSGCNVKAQGLNPCADRYSFSGSLKISWTILTRRQALKTPQGFV